MRSKDMSEGFHARLQAGALLVGAIALAASFFVTAAVTARGQEKQEKEVQSQVPVAPAGRWQVTAHLVDGDGAVQDGYRYTPDGQLTAFNTEKECTDFAADDAQLAVAEKSLDAQLAEKIEQGAIPPDYTLTWQCEQLDKAPQNF